MVDTSVPIAAPETPVRPASAGPVVDTLVRVRFAETDAMGVVYHANYLIWFEVGRAAYWHALALGESGEADAGAFAVATAEVHYHMPARYGDQVLVSTWVREVRSRSLTFGYECLRQPDGLRLATGHTTHVRLDAAGHACRLPEPLRRALLGQRP
ncbi:MAG: acyl-CoA thioesterase [Anaerolineae bacterium]